MSDPTALPPSPAQPKLSDRVSAEIRTKHYSRRTEEVYALGKDIDFACRKITVSEGKGAQDRVTMLAEMCVPALRKHIEDVKGRDDKDLSKGFGTVHMPYAPARKYPNANREWGRQYVFPASSPSTDPRTGVKQRHHLDESTVQKAVRQAIRSAGLHKHAGCHSLRHSFAAHLPEAGHDIRTVPELMGHEDLNATMVCYVLNRGIPGVRRPSDMLGIKHHMRPGNPFACLPPAIADRFASIVATRYGDDFEAAISAFVNLDGEK